MAEDCFSSLFNGITSWINNANLLLRLLNAVLGASIIILFAQ